MKWGERVAWFLLGALLVGIVAWRTIAKRQEKLNQMYAADSVKSQATLIERVRLEAERDSSRAQYLRLSVYAQAADERTAAARAQLASVKPLRAALDTALTMATSAGDSVVALTGIVRNADAVIVRQTEVIAAQGESLDLRAQQIASLNSSLRTADSLTGNWKGEAERWRALADSMRRIPTAGPGKKWLGFITPPTCVAGVGPVVGEAVTPQGAGLGGAAGVGVLCGVKLGR